MMKFLRYKKSIDSKLYREIIEAAVRRLTDVGIFRKNQVLDETGYGEELCDMIRWDYVQRYIEEYYQIELIPLAERYFKRGGQTVPEACIAGGNGRRTVGYATVDKRNHTMVIIHLQRKNGIAQGFAKSFEHSKAVAIDTQAVAVQEVLKLDNPSGTP